MLKVKIQMQHEGDNTLCRVEPQLASFATASSKW